MSTLDRLFRQSTELSNYAARYAAYLMELLECLDLDAVGRAGVAFEEARHRDNTIFFIGNGGSAATASHCANDFGFGPRRIGGRPYRAISLTDNVAFMTAAANDTGHESMFVEQLKTLMRSGDVVVAISASGNSPNVLDAVRYAARHGATTIGLTGFDGGELLRIVDVAIHVSTPQGDYGPVEDIHLILEHILSSYLARMTTGIAHEDEADQVEQTRIDETASASNVRPLHREPSGV
jgi:D-sedoheptulose 7-phosphate isomerase